MRKAPFIQYFSGGLGVSPGAMVMGYESEMLAWRPAIGAAIGQRRQWNTFAGQNYQIQALAALTGLTGVVHGQNALQPLTNPYAKG